MSNTRKNNASLLLCKRRTPETSPVVTTIQQRPSSGDGHDRGGMHDKTQVSDSDNNDDMNDLLTIDLLEDDAPPSLNSGRRNNSAAVLTTSSTVVSPTNPLFSSSSIINDDSSRSMTPPTKRRRVEALPSAQVCPCPSLDHLVHQDDDTHERIMSARSYGTAHDKNRVQGGNHRIAHHPMVSPKQTDAHMVSPNPNIIPLRKTSKKTASATIVTKNKSLLPVGNRSDKLSRVTTTTARKTRRTATPLPQPPRITIPQGKRVTCRMLSYDVGIRNLGECIVVQYNDGSVGLEHIKRIDILTENRCNVNNCNQVTADRLSKYLIDYLWRNAAHVLSRPIDKIIIERQPGLSRKITTLAFVLKSFYYMYHLMSSCSHYHVPPEQQQGQQHLSAATSTTSHHHTIHPLRPNQQRQNLSPSGISNTEHHQNNATPKKNIHRMPLIKFQDSKLKLSIFADQFLHPEAHTVTVAHSSQDVIAWMRQQTSIDPRQQKLDKMTTSSDAKRKQSSSVRSTTTTTTHNTLSTTSRHHVVVDKECESSDSTHDKNNSDKEQNNLQGKKKKRRPRGYRRCTKSRAKANYRINKIHARNETDKLMNEHEGFVAWANYYYALGSKRDDVGDAILQALWEVVNRRSKPTKSKKRATCLTDAPTDDVIIIDDQDVVVSFEECDDTSSYVTTDDDDYGSSSSDKE